MSEMEGDVSVGALCVSSDVQSVAESRRWLKDVLAADGVHPECIEIATLVISELVSNAVRVGTGDVLCHAVLDSAACTLSVVDFGGGTPSVQDRRVDTVGGLGLVIVERLSRAWGVVPFESGKAVYAVLDADRLGATPSASATGGTDAVA